MALRPVWAANAQRERKDILRYFRERNGNSRYSRELAKRFDECIDLVAERELIGKPTDWEGVRCLFVLDYSLFYILDAEYLVVLSIWDNRRDPQKKPF